VSLQRHADIVLVTIEDDGVGFDAVSVQQQGARVGLGLIGIRERALQLHGTLRIQSGPGIGTRLTVQLPARSRPDSSDQVLEAFETTVEAATSEVPGG
jgi:signal transduction histidine kinase